MKLEWFGYPGHFIASRRCNFRMVTLVNDEYLVSTIGDFFEGDQGEPTEIGCGRTFETYVFKGPFKRCECGCQHIMPVSWQEIDSSGYMDAGDAKRGHMEMVDRYGALGSASL